MDNENNMTHLSHVQKKLQLKLSKFISDEIKEIYIILF